MRLRPTRFGVSLILLALSGCGGVDNATPERAAKCMLAAMIKADSKTIDALNKSEPGGWSTSSILEGANRWKVVGSDISDYRLKKTADNEYELGNEKRGVAVYMKLILADGRYYAVSCYAAPREQAPVKKETWETQKSINNLKAIGLAIHNYTQAHKTFPPAYTSDKNGKAVLSWRVAILPFMGYSDLYREFHRDEPWDSEHNKMLLSKMPDAYKTPGSTVADQWKTNYLTVRGEDTIFSGKIPATFASIRDGTSNTIMTVEVSDAKAVEWTRPDDFEYNPQDPIEGLVGLRRNGFLAEMGDGWVHFYRSSRDAETLRALFNKSDGKVVNAESDSLDDE